MRIWAAALLAGAVLAPVIPAQDGPNQTGSATVARPRPKPGAPSGSPDAPSSPDDTVAPPAAAAPAPSGDQAPIPSKLSPKATKDNDQQADATFHADTNIVSVDVAVIDSKGNPIPNIPKENFRVLEDNVPQTVSQYSVAEAPMTVALVIEFSGRFQAFYSYGWYETLQATYGFVSTLKPDDYLAVIAYDLKETILSDFTNDRNKTSQALSMLRVPGFSESNMFDALADTSDRMSKIEGRKAIVLISSGIDTFSKLTYDKARKALQESGVPVYSIEMLQIERLMSNMGPSQELDFLQGDNELRTFAKDTGGQAFFPRFIQELPQVYQSISRALRTEYTLGYSPNNQAKDGSFRKIAIQLVNPASGQPLRLQDEKGKPIKYSIVAKAGYTAPRAVE